jgi:cell division protein FtsZ
MVRRTTGDKGMTAKIKVIGVGGGGGNAVRHMLTAEMKGIELICANTDAQALERVPGDDVRFIQLGERLTGGLGAGANPAVGREAAAESLGAVKEAIGDAHMLFVTAGMGGGTGTGAAPVVAQAAREMGILTVGVVTRPFLHETQRHKIAEEGIAELRRHVDSLIVIPNARLQAIAPRNAKLVDMFRLADTVLYTAVRGIADLIIRPGYINLDFADVRTAMGNAGYATMGTGCARGEGRALEAARRAITSPLLDDVSIAGAKSVLVNVTSTLDIGMDEFSDAMCAVQEAARGERGDGNIIAGLSFDESAGEELRITVIATGVSYGGERGQDADDALAQSEPARSGARITSFQESGRFRSRGLAARDEEKRTTSPPARRETGPGQPLSRASGQDDVQSGPDEDLELPVFFRGT